MKELIKRRLVFVEAEQTMTEVVKTMIEQNISSVLVLNRERIVTGIVTERDIVQKFTLLESARKLDAIVIAFMTRPVSFARLGHLEDDVRDMFFQRRFRHFPVSDGSFHERDVLGMLTVTDMTSAYLRSSQTMKIEMQREPVVIISGDEGARDRYKKLFEALQYLPITHQPVDRLLRQAREQKIPVVFDVDDMPLEEAKRTLSRLRDFDGTFIILSSQASLVEPLSRMLSNENHIVALKPLDISYILLLLSRLQAPEKKVQEA